MSSEASKIAALEALLFVHGEPLTGDKIEKILELKPGEAEGLLKELVGKFESEERGLYIVSSSGKFQLSTKPAFSSILEKFIKDELSGDLTPASLEALAIIAYLGPISRSRLEYLRGVNSVFTLRSLLLRGLIERESDPKRLSTFLYKPSVQLVRHLGLSKGEDLPDYEKLRTAIQDIESTKNQELLKQSEPSSENQMENQTL